MKRGSGTTLVALTAASVVAGESTGFRYKDQIERDLSGSGDAVSFDDDFWAYNDGSMQTYWDDYSIKPLKCMIRKKKHLIAYQMFGKNNNQCARRGQGYYTMDVGQFSRAYVAQRQVDYNLKGNNYGNPDAMDYLECTAVEYNDSYYYAKLGCNAQGGLKLMAFTDEYCNNEYSGNIGLYNDIKIQYHTCHSCVSWPAAANDDAAGSEYAVDVDDQFDGYHAYDSKLCSAAENYGSSCTWGCKSEAKKKSAGENMSYGSGAHRWNAFEKFFLFLWTAAGVALVWVVLKQRRMMSREDAIVEEAAMNGIGLKKRHVFPIVLGVVFMILFSMFMVWKKLTWFLLIGANLGLAAHFVYMRRRAKHASGTGEVYVKDAGLEIS